MSHIVVVQTEIRDPVAIAAACARLQLPAPSHRTVELFSGEATGLAIELPDWRFPVVCQAESGTLCFDNFEGRWGDPAHLERFKQMYAVEKGKIEMRKKSQTPVEQALADGWILVRAVVPA